MRKLFAALPAILAIATVAAIGLDVYRRASPRSHPHTSVAVPADSNVKRDLGLDGFNHIIVHDTEYQVVAKQAGEAASPESWLRVFVVLLILGAALFVILSKKYDDADRKWVYGAVGAILGYVIGHAV